MDPNDPDYYTHSPGSSPGHAQSHIRSDSESSPILSEPYAVKPDPQHYKVDPNYATDPVDPTSDPYSQPITSLNQHNISSVLSDGGRVVIDPKAVTFNRANADRTSSLFRKFRLTSLSSLSSWVTNLNDYVSHRQCEDLENIEGSNYLDQQYNTGDFSHIEVLKSLETLIVVFGLVLGSKH